MFEQWKYKKKRKAEIESLRKNIAEQYASQLKGAVTAQEKGGADQIAYSVTQHERNTLDYLEQEDLLKELAKAPLGVPEEYWYDQVGDTRRRSITKEKCGLPLRIPSFSVAVTAEGWHNHFRHGQGSAPVATLE